jgi:hypothetical protein
MTEETYQAARELRQHLENLHQYRHNNLSSGVDRLSSLSGSTKDSIRLLIKADLDAQIATAQAELDAL